MMKTRAGFVSNSSSSSFILRSHAPLTEDILWHATAGMAVDSFYADSVTRGKIVDQIMADLRNPTVDEDGKCCYEVWWADHGDGGTSITSWLRGNAETLNTDALEVVYECEG
jgi:hypothetical protein